MGLPILPIVHGSRVNIQVLSKEILFEGVLEVWFFCVE